MDPIYIHHRIGYGSHIFKILSFYHRFLYSSSLWNTQKEEIDKCLSDYFIQTPESTDTKKLVKHIINMDSQSKKQQFTLLSSISNYHYIDYPSFGMNPKYGPTKQIIYSMTQLKEQQKKVFQPENTFHVPPEINCPISQCLKNVNTNCQKY